MKTQEGETDGGIEEIFSRHKSVEDSVFIRRARASEISDDVR